MSSTDYYNCDNCGRGKVMYDADVNWESSSQQIGAIRIICKSCIEDGFSLKIEKKGQAVTFNKLHNFMVHHYINEGTEDTINE